MFILSHFLKAVADILNIILSLYMWVIIIRAIISWVNPDPYNPIVRFLHNITEPVLYRIRKVLPPIGGIDLSPLVAILAIIFLKEFFVRVLYDLAFQLR